MTPDAIPPAWRAHLAEAMATPAMRATAARIAAAERAGVPVYPPAGQRFRMFAETPPERVRAVILGQDPYHGPGQAHGLAFSVPYGVPPPPSLRNIFTELTDDLGLERPRSGDLTPWARQGVLLLNSALSVEEGRAGSHAGPGWDAVTDAAIRAVAAGSRPVAFVLWGRHAQAKAGRIAELRDPRHLMIESAHPSPLSARRGFFGSRPFSRVNAFLAASGQAPIDWSLG